MNLSNIEINAFDVRLNYTGAGVVSKVKSIDYSAPGIFNSAQILAECNDGIAVIGGGCPPGDSPSAGQVHLAGALLGSSVTGPFTAALVFSLNVTVQGPGISIFSFDRANFVNQGSDPSYPNPRFIGIVLWDGIFANTMGVVAFFNFEPSSPPAFLPGQAVWFNSSISLPSTGASLASFTWDFGDTSSPVTVPEGSYPHQFLSPGTYQVMLTATDSLGQVGSVTRKVVIVNSLGGLDLFIRDRARGTARSGVLVEVENSTTPARIFNKTSDLSGGVSFRGLTQGSYVLLFSGGGLVAPKPATLSVSAGLISMDTLYLDFVDPSPPSDLPGIIFIATLVGGVSLVAIVAFVKKRKMKRQIGSAKASRLKRA
ncbi:PKD domain-containing protein [Candidatus Bathyarchaeota archaeon]|nr:MAG: PKD domain-containing protein [Candidatus Bathyarchaeota archaeon]